MLSSYYYACNNSFLGMIVHRKGCINLIKKKQAFLGSFYGYAQAMVVARQRYPEIDQCYECANWPLHHNSSSAKVDNQSVNTINETAANPALMPSCEDKPKNAAQYKLAPRKHYSP